MPFCINSSSELNETDFKHIGYLPDITNSSYALDNVTATSQHSNSSISTHPYFLDEVGNTNQFEDMPRNTNYEETYDKLDVGLKTRLNSFFSKFIPKKIQLKSSKTEATDFPSASCVQCEIDMKPEHISYDYESNQKSNNIRDRNPHQGVYTIENDTIRDNAHVNINSVENFYIEKSPLEDSIQKYETISLKTFQAPQ